MDKQQFLNLQQGKKYTIWFFNDFGFPCTMQIRLVKVEVRPYAQYPEVVVLSCVPKGKRNAWSTVIKPGQNFIVWLGWIEVKADMYVKSEITKEGYTVRESRLCFDQVYMEDAINSVEEKPIVVSGKIVDKNLGNVL